MIENGQVDLEKAQGMMQGFSSVNLDEVNPEVIEVVFREFKPGSDGKGFVIEAVPKKINNWVPMFLFHRMLANQKKVQNARKRRLVQAEFTIEEDQKEFDPLAEDDTLDFAALTDEMFKEIIGSSEPALVWQAKEVLQIWKLTPGEEGMSLKRLVLGLSFEFIQKLFTLFFGAMLLQKQSKA